MQHTKTLSYRKLQQCAKSLPALQALFNKSGAIFIVWDQPAISEALARVSLTFISTVEVLDFKLKIHLSQHPAIDIVLLLTDVVCLRGG